ncbi:Alcohol dehydrogenase superfamily, zinc-type [Corchorus olitorius]|uniref:Alcohol dehydrogenase superfamily, zinc-type n=1 Tax=Corchorus olitorius TaxID=93759 RepID=A0A1R3I4U0_9ROSI|nr:Alcohol dehydrogenase superfamily, zinc-type [Corchorus olitorius]
MTNGGVDRSVACTGSINAMIFAVECVHDGWGVVVFVGVPNKDDAFKTHPVNLLNERTLKGTFFGNYKPCSDLPSVVEKYMNKELELERVSGVSSARRSKTIERKSSLLVFDMKNEIQTCI